MNLSELATKYGSDKGPGPHGHDYTPHYERAFARLRAQAVVLLEVGVFQGASLRMWSDWFLHPETRIVGVDVQLRPVDHPKVELVQADVRALPATLPALLDVVVDDGSHLAHEIAAGMRFLWPRLVAGGWYVVEDVGSPFGALCTQEEFQLLLSTLRPEEAMAWRFRSRHPTDAGWIWFVLKLR